MPPNYQSFGCGDVWAVDLGSLGSFLGFNGSLLTHGSENDDVGVLLVDPEELVDLLTNFTVGHLDIVLGVTVIVHEGEEIVVGDIKKLVLTTSDVGNVHVVGRGGEIFVLLGREDVDGDQVDLGVTVLSSLGGGHVDNLARAPLDHDEAVLAQSRTLHGVGEGRAGVGGVEGNIMFLSYCE